MCGCGLMEHQAVLCRKRFGPTFGHVFLLNIFFARVIWQEAAASMVNKVWEYWGCLLFASFQQMIVQQMNVQCNKCNQEMLQ